MKRKFISLLLIVVLTIAMAGCKGKSINTNTNNSQTGGLDKDNSNIINNSTDNSTNTPTPSKADPQAVENQTEQKEIFYGEWSINKQLAYGPVGTYSKDDIKKMLGKRLSYSNEKAMYETNTCEKPAYKKSTISQADFEVNNKIKFSNLGITDTSIVQAIIYTDSGYKDIWNSTGCTFYIKDHNTLILFDGGVYFELDRVTN